MFSLSNSCAAQKNEEESSKIFSHQELYQLDPEKIPSHVAIIMDGNRRWALNQQFSICSGHRQGAKNLIDIVKASKEMGIKVLTVYGLSTENLSNRGQIELDALFQLIVDFLERETPTLIAQDVRFHTIGDLSKLSDHLNHVISESKRQTRNCHEMDFVVALNYGSRNEIVRASKKALQDILANKQSLETLDEKTFSQYLDTHAWPDPELLIRTSGEIRISNFLLWQISYAEFYSTKKFWPEFSPQDYLAAIKEFQERERRLGD